MRFKAGLAPTPTFQRLVSSLSSLGVISWLRLTDSLVRFTVIPESGTQVWAALAIDSIFENYTIQSAADENTINLEVPLPPLLAALRSASTAMSASLRLTKKDGIPYLCLTIMPLSISSGAGPVTSLPHHHAYPQQHSNNSAAAHPTSGGDTGGYSEVGDNEVLGYGHSYARDRERETIVTQDVPVRVLSAEQVAGLHEPRCREPDVHIYLPPLAHLKAISDRFGRLASGSDLATSTGALAAASLLGNSNNNNNNNNNNTFSSATAGPGRSGGGSSGKSPKLELSANMHGSLRLSVAAEGINISSTWKDLINPELDAAEVDLPNHPSTLMRQTGDWATVRIDGRDWSRVLSVGRLGGRVIACFAHEHALILYVYLLDNHTGDNAAGGGVGTGGSVLTYYVSSYSL